MTNRNRIWIVSAVASSCLAWFVAFGGLIHQPAAAAPANSQQISIAFQGVWAFAQDPSDANRILAFAAQSNGHHELFVQGRGLAPGVYELSMPAPTVRPEP